MCNRFRTLRHDEIDVRVQQVKKNGQGKVYAMLLLYKDARVDMTLLDEEFGIFGWQREHEFKDGKNYCKVSVYDGSRWVAKEDVGVPSNTEEEKGQASDAFKRACVNLGIGRELYTSPRIIIELATGEWYEGKDTRAGQAVRLSNNVTFSVKAIEYDERRAISALTIVDSKGNIRKQIGKCKELDVYAVEEMNKASKEEAAKVWRKWPELHDNARFISAYTPKRSNNEAESI